MAAYSRVGWTDHTFSPWWGCVRVSPGCEHCYAEAWAKRTGHSVWGARAARRFFTAKHWKDVLGWDRAAGREGVIRSVFCGSMCDFAEINEHVPALDETREWLFELIEHTKNLRWLLLTKRPENVLKVVPKRWLAGFPWNVWVGSTFEDQRRLLERWPHLDVIPAHLFGSLEPLLGPVEFFPSMVAGYDFVSGRRVFAQRLSWLIVGGESGGQARPYDLDWGRSILEAGRDAGIPVYHKQLGSHAILNGNRIAVPKSDPKGEDWDNWGPELHEFQVRNFPWVPAPQSPTRAARRSGRVALPVVAT
jgi:protein gp37